MLDLSAHYDEMYHHARAGIAAGAWTADTLIDDPRDNRFGLIINIRPSAGVRSNVLAVQREFIAVDSGLYIYPETDLHITVIAIISCTPGFTTDQLNLPEYEAVIAKAAAEISSFQIRCAGITAFPGGIIMQGFPSGDELMSLRNNLRTLFAQSPLYNTIDIRYRLETAHSTIIRIRKSLVNVEQFVSKMDELRDHYFGTIDVNEIEVVYGDWYQRADRTRLLKKISLIKHQ